MAIGPVSRADYPRASGTAARAVRFDEGMVATLDPG